MSKILVISNGHGEDLSGRVLIQHLLQIDPSLSCSALPIVGTGNAYRRSEIPVIAPTLSLPSGGFSYMSIQKLWQDMQSGLVPLTWQQWQIARRYECDLVVAIGDVVPLLFAGAGSAPYIFYFVAMSAHYEGATVIHPLAKPLMRSQRCRRIFTRDSFTAEDLQRRGYQSAQFVGNPFMSDLVAQGVDLYLDHTQKMVALLPGSRLPEAEANFRLMLQLLPDLTKTMAGLQFRSAVVPSFSLSSLQIIAKELGWQLFDRSGHFELRQGQVQVLVYNNAFADILEQCDLAIGMAGTANEQAVGLGKPVVQLVGAGPQFTYRFAEAQKRLLGISIHTCPTLDIAKAVIPQILNDPALPDRCRENAYQKLGDRDGALQMAQSIYQILQHCDQ